MFRKRHRSRPQPVVEVCPDEVKECAESFESCETEVCEAPMVTDCCEGKILTTRTLSECSNHHIPLGHKVIARLPVVLAELLVQVDVESIIKLEEPALEIKRIMKNVHINQCKLLLPTHKLFISGFVRKNIEFATVGCVSGRGISGDIKHTTVNIPFECVTKVEFDQEPCFALTVPGADREIEFLNKCLLGANRNEQTFVDIERFTEKPFCELIFAHITEADIECENIPVEFNPRENLFQTVKEKMVLHLMVKVLQNQQVKIPKAHLICGFEKEECEECEECED